jgi:chromosome partitioning protein
LYHVLVMGMPVEQAVVNARPNLDVLCANETLAAAELYLAGRQNRDRILATRLASAREHYDSIVVDCSPSLGLRGGGGGVFSSSVLCPVACDYLSLVGVRQVVKTIKNVNRLLAHPVTLWGVLPTHYDRRARICNEALETLREHFQERCLSPIRAAIRVKEAPSQGKTLFEYDPDSDVAKDYWALVERVNRASAAAPQTAEHLLASA